MENQRAEFRLDVVSGWIQTDMSAKWFDRFVHFESLRANDPVLLTVDDHYSHTKNLYMWCIKPGNTVFSTVSLPPHSKHKMQPLDVGTMKPLETYYSQE